jgi:Asp-tRNA(Asn)/Glu-tRNA(Gln) amidotransferase B subunit
LLESGCPVPQETRGFDENKAETFRLRSKEDSPDYRYMPDPNIPPLLISEVHSLHLFLAVLLKNIITGVHQGNPEVYAGAS